jgi:hypothetical protein
MFSEQWRPKSNGRARLGKTNGVTHDGNGSGGRMLKLHDHVGLNFGVREYFIEGPHTRT